MSTGRALVAVAVVLGAGAAVAGSPYRASRLPFDADRMTAAIASAEDRVGPLDLARWIRDRRDGLRVIDVRERAAFDDFHIPTAEWVPLARLSRTGFGDGETVVLYGAADGPPAQGWLLLRASGYEPVYYLQGGVRAWTRDVLAPTLAADATPEERQAFRDISELSRYFGGIPRTGGPRESATPWDGTDSTLSPAPGRARRRGCAW